MYDICFLMVSGVIISDVKLQLNLSILYGTYNSFLALHCAEKDEIRLMGVLKFSMFLAMNGL